MKYNFFDIQNVLRSLKVWVAGIVSGLILILPLILIRFLYAQGLMGVGLILGILTSVADLFLFGLLLNKFYGWK